MSGITNFYGGGEMGMGGEKFEHESYGMVDFSRLSCSGSGPQLFGSMVKSPNVMRLRVARGGMERHLNREWFFAKENVIEIDLSPTQFAELLTTVNVGSGVPCTLKYVDGHKMENPPEYNVQEQFRNEVKHDSKEAVEHLTGAEDYLQKIINGEISGSKKNLRELSGQLFEASRRLTDYMPFAVKSHLEAMDTATAQAKAVVSAFHDHAVANLGLKALAAIEEEGISTEKPILTIE